MFSITLDITLKYTRISSEIPAEILKIPLTPSLSPWGKGKGEGNESKFID
jgi:hypothetical protein